MNKQYYTKKWENAIKKASKSSISMRAACSKLGLHPNTFIKHAKRLNCYKPNPAGIGIKKIKPSLDIMIVLSGKYPEYNVHRLRLRLIKEGFKKHQCENCKRCKWLTKPISLELNHIDGNHFNHLLENLQLLCPNCHAQTSNYRGKNIKKKRTPNEI